MPRGLVGGAVAQRRLGASCFRFPERGPARRGGDAGLGRGRWDPGLLLGPRWPRLPAPHGCSPGDAELCLLPLPAPQVRLRNRGAAWRRRPEGTAFPRSKAPARPEAGSGRSPGVESRWGCSWGFAGRAPSEEVWRRRLGGAQAPSSCKVRALSRSENF